nr:hypothetical protein [Borreliella turdi]
MCKIGRCFDPNFKVINNREDVYIETSNLLKPQILAYPFNPELIKFEPSKYMLPTLN